MELAGHRATALALVFSRAPLERARARRRPTSRSLLRATGATPFSSIADDGHGMRGRPTAPGSRSSARSSVTSSAGSARARPPREVRFRGLHVARERSRGGPGLGGRDDDAHPDRGRRDDHPARPARAAREARLRGRRRGADGEEAVALASSETPDLALLDVKMPKLDGIDAARRILDERPIPIVMVTAYGEQELVSRAVEAGVFGYLVKPFRETRPAAGDRRRRARATRSSRRSARRPPRSPRRSPRARRSSARRGC